MANVLYNDFIDQNELESEVSLMQESLKIDKLILAYNTVMEQEELNLREAELKCMMESAGMNDLADYYKEAADETAEKKDGLIKRIWEQIKTFFSKLKEFLFGSKQMKKLDADAAKGEVYGVDADAEQTLSKLGQLKNMVGKGFEGFKKQGAWKILLELLGLATLGAAVPLTVHNVKKVKAGDIKGIKDWVNEWCEVIKSNTVDKVLDIFKGIKDKLTDKNGQQTPNASSFLGKIKSFFNKIANWIKGLIPGGKSESEDKSGKENKDDKSGKTLDDLDDKQKDSFKKRMKEINVKYHGDKNNPDWQKEVSRLRNHFGLAQESVMEYLEEMDMFTEDAEDDIFELDDLFAESSDDTNDLDDIVSLLNTL